MSVLIKYAAVGNGLGTNPTGAAGGDLLGTFPSPSVIAATFNGTRIPYSSTPPSSGQLLGYDGSNIVGINKGLVKIASATASGSATLDFTGLTGYTAYAVVLNNVVPATNSVDFQQQWTSNNGSSWLTTNYYWAWSYASTAASTTPAASTNTGGQGAENGSCNTLFTTVSNTSGLGISGTLFINLANASARPTLTGVASAFSAVTSKVYSVSIGCEYGTNTAANGIRFMFASGNISTGTITVYGLY